MSQDQPRKRPRFVVSKRAQNEFTVLGGQRPSGALAQARAALASAHQKSETRAARNRQGTQVPKNDGGGMATPTDGVFAAAPGQLTATVKVSRISPAGQVRAPSEALALARARLVGKPALTIRRLDDEWFEVREANGNLLKVRPE